MEVADLWPVGYSGSKLRLSASDGRMHEVGSELNFSESVYFNFYEQAIGLGGFFRIANRPNEGIGEVTICLYLPDGSVAFSFKRPEIADNLTFDAGGLRVSVLEPFHKIQVSYSGEACHLIDPLQLSDPRLALRTNPYEPCTVELSYRDVSPPVGGLPLVAGSDAREGFARGHYDQLVSVSGTVMFAGTRWSIESVGQSDHSWGPRSWQSPWYYRWMIGSFGQDSGFMVARIAQPDRDGSRAGFLWTDRRVIPCRIEAIETRWSTNWSNHEGVMATLRSREFSWRIEGEILNYVPLRNRKVTQDGTEFITRIGEGLTKWTRDDGRTGYGMTEYLDQVVDGIPVGLAE